MDDALSRDREYWDRHARRDPLWAILSDPSRANRGWDLQSFMESGEREISLLLNEIARLGLRLNHRDALDFGCGVGRLSQALARRFDRVVGVDISPAMIELARSLDRYPGRVDYRVNTPSLIEALRGCTFDFIYSNIVLQHVPPDAARGYLRDFLTLVRPDGLLVFQLPSHRCEVTDRGPEPMPADAYAARLSPALPLPESIRPGDTLTAAIEIQNGSGHAWDQSVYGSLRAGNHWLDGGGSMVIQDDGRAALPAVLAPGGRAVVEIGIRAPATAGHYILEIDAVHEGVTWFADRGSRTLRHPVTVGEDLEAREAPASPGNQIPDYRGVDAPGAADETDAAARAEPFPMHGIERDAVITLLTSAGGEVVHIADDDRARPEWAAYRYFVRRRLH